MTDTETSLIKTVIDEAKRIEEDATYSAKGHFESARKWKHADYVIGIPTVMLAASSGTLSLSNSPTIAAVIAFSAALLAGIGQFIRSNERHYVHLACANSYNQLRNQARIFSRVECVLEVVSNEVLKQRIETLDNTRNHLNSTSPQISRGAFLRAKRGIEKGETVYEVDATNESGDQE